MIADLPKLELPQSNSTHFTPEEIFKLFSQMSQLYEYQGKCMTQLLKMVASLISAQQEHLLIQGSTYKKDPPPAKKSQKVIVPIPEVDEKIQEEKIMNLEPKIVTNPIVLTSDEDQIVRCAPSKKPKEYEEIQVPSIFQKQFKKHVVEPNLKKKQKIDTKENSRFEENLQQQKDESKDREQQLVQQDDNSVNNSRFQKFFKQTIRNKQERRQQPGHDCVDCQQFYEGLQVPGERCFDCSRHRGYNNVMHQELNLFPSPMD